MLLHEVDASNTYKWYFYNLGEILKLKEKIEEHFKSFRNKMI